MNNENLQSSDRLQKLYALRSQYLDQSIPPDQLPQVMLDIKALVSDLDTGEKKSLELFLKTQRESKRDVDPLDAAISFGPTRATLRALGKDDDKGQHPGIKSLAAERERIAAAEQEVTSHQSLIQKLFKRHPSGIVQRPAETTQPDAIDEIAQYSQPAKEAQTEMPANSKTVIDAKGIHLREDSDRIDAPDQTAAAEFDPQSGDNGAMQSAKVIQVAEELRSKPSDGETISQGSGLDNQPSGESANMPRGRVEQMAGENMPAKAEDQGQEAVNPQNEPNGSQSASQPLPPNIQAPALESQTVRSRKPSIFDIFRRVPKGDVDVDQFVPIQEAAEGRSVDQAA